jgi:hypothetical protein
MWRNIREKRCRNKRLSAHHSYTQPITHAIHSANHARQTFTHQPHLWQAATFARHTFTHPPVAGCGWSCRYTQSFARHTLNHSHAIHSNIGTPYIHAPTTPMAGCNIRTPYIHAPTHLWQAAGGPAGGGACTGTAFVGSTAFCPPIVSATSDHPPWL